MSIAYKAATLITAYCETKWPGDVSMASTMADHFAGYFDGASSYSHKHVQQLDEINERLGAKPGAGVYWAWRFSDGTQMLLTCEGPLAVIDEQGLRAVCL